MNTTQIGTSSLLGGRLAYGCWRIAGNHPAQLTPQQADAGRRAVIAAYEAGYTLFDHADIYGRGVAETLFGQVLKEIASLRDRIVIATKCGVCPKGIPEPNLPARWDFSARHIVAACDGSLRRMGIETIDLLMLHRPDYLADPEEVARAFTDLKASGKVRFFGVSNFRPSLVTAVQAACEFPLVAHQVEISLAKLDAFTDGTLDQCLQDRMTPMAWSPLAGGLLGEGATRLLPAQQGYRVAPIVTMLDEMAREHGVSRAVIALAWLLKHPGKIVPLVGSTNPDRIRDAAKAADLDLSREEWYRLLEAARGEPLP
ncbi:MAG: aldo/keto reductase [Thermoguttaceae bacterium]